MIEYNIIGRRVYHLRHFFGITQKELAVWTGLSQTIISRIENGDSPLTLSDINAVAQALHCPIVTLISPHEEWFEKQLGQLILISEKIKGEYVLSAKQKK
jgi:transcriptional regulator with XRE-family HTH domain